MRITTLILALLFVNTLFAQNEQVPQCGQNEAINAMEAKYPGYINAINRVFEKNKIQAAQKTNSEEIYRIPVVFHVVYLGEDDNLSDEIIEGQIAQLNQDFRRLNADSTDTRDVFQPYAGDAKIEFVLATIDPNGNPTSGITRTAGSASFLNYSTTPFDNAVKHTDQGGIDAWDTDRYLNVWSCDMSLPFLGPAVLGFAYPPADLANWPAGSQAPDPSEEGVVVHYQAIGPNNPNSGTLAGITDRGRTAVHEVGHYLGLRHIWGDGDCTADDGVDDTPNATGNAAQGCNLNSNTCTDNIDGNDFPDMIENYMDYADEDCMNMFTKGQIAIMRSVLENERASIVITTPLNTNEVNPLDKVLTIAPNPTRGQIRLQITHNESLDYTISIRNMLGQIIEQPIKSTNPHASYNLDLSQYQNGIYLIEMQSGQHITTKRLF